jgi:hypothetical protein
VTNKILNLAVEMMELRTKWRTLSIYEKFEQTVLSVLTPPNSPLGMTTVQRASGPSSQKRGMGTRQNGKFDLGRITRSMEIITSSTD